MLQMLIYTCTQNYLFHKNTSCTCIYGKYTWNTLIWNFALYHVTCHTLKTNSCHADNFVIIIDITGCHNSNMQCQPWQQNQHHDIFLYKYIYNSNCLEYIFTMAVKFQSFTGKTSLVWEMRFNVVVSLLATAAKKALLPLGVRLATSL